MTAVQRDLDRLVTLTDALTRLAEAGYWIEAWYPLSDDSFECRVTNGPRMAHWWAVDPEPLVALVGAMRKAGITITREDDT